MNYQGGIFAPLPFPRMEPTMKNEPSLVEVEKEVGKILSPRYARAETESRTEPDPPAKERPVVTMNPVAGVVGAGPHQTPTPKKEPDMPEPETDELVRLEVTALLDHAYSKWLHHVRSDMFHVGSRDVRVRKMIEALLFSMTISNANNGFNAADFR